MENEMNETVEEGQDNNAIKQMRERIKELEEIKLLEAEEASRFTPTGGAARRGGRVTGLTQQ